MLLVTGFLREGRKLLLRTRLLLKGSRAQPIVIAASGLERHLCRKGNLSNKTHKKVSHMTQLLENNSVHESERVT